MSIDPSLILGQAHSFVTCGCWSHNKGINLAIPLSHRGSRHIALYILIYVCNRHTDVVFSVVLYNDMESLDIGLTHLHLPLIKAME